MESRKIKILAIDDNKDNLVTLQALIKDTCPDTITFTALNGNKGLELAAAEDPDVILLDVVMPGLDGFEVCNKLKANKKLSDIPVVFVTALKGDKENRIRALECGAEAFLAKPIEESELTAQIRAMVKIKTASIEKRNEKERLAALVEEKTRELRETYNTAMHLLGDLKTENEARKKSEEALRESERKFSIAFKTSPYAITITRADDGKFIDINDAFPLITGFTKEEALSNSSVGLQLWADIEDRKSVVAALNKGKEVVDKEYQFVKKNGEIIVCLFSASVITLNNEHYILSSINDITERKRAEERIRESEDRYKRITEGLTDYLYTVIIKDGKAIETIHNEVCLAITGYSSKEFESDPYIWINMVVPEERELVVAKVSKILEGNDSSPFEHRIVCKDGTIHWICDTAIPKYDSNSVLVSYDGVIKDITERKRSEEALRESEIRFRTLYENISIGIYRTSPDGNILLANPALVKMLGYTSFQQLAEINLEKDGFESSSQRKDFLEKIERDGDVKGHDSKWISKDGTAIFVLESARVIRDSLGKTLYYDGTVEDITERKQAEETLREQDALLRSVMEKLPVGVWISDVKGTIITGNEAGKKIWAGSRYIGVEQYGEYKGWRADTGKRIEPEEWAAARAITKGEISLDEEIIIECFDGTRKTILNSALPLRDTNQRITGAIIINQDISERKQVEEALRINSERLSIALKSANSGIWEWNLLTNEIIWSEEVWRLYGIEPHSCSPSYEIWQQIIHPDDRENTEKKLQEAACTGNELNVEWRAVGRDGAVRWLMSLGRALQDAHGKFVRFIGIVLDITERKRAEGDIKKLSSAVEQSGSSIVITNLKGEIEYVNAKFVEITGYSNQEAIGKNPRILKSEHTSSEEYKNLWNTITNGQIWRGEFYNKKKNGELFWESATISPVRSADGIMTHFIAVKEDITQQRLMADQLRQMQKLEGLGTLAGGIAHDFNNILGIILAYVGSINRNKADPEKLNHAIATISKAVDRGKTLVLQILTFARKSDIAFGPVNVNDVVMEIMIMVFETFPKVLTYAQNFDKSITFINADRSQLHQALLNLCVNARDAMSSGGVLTINTRMVSGLSLRNRHPNVTASGYVCIEVSDTGEGMSGEIQKRIFEPFFTTKEIGKGTGLGLAVVFGVAQTHKGFIDVESELGKGTTFRLYLPALQVAAPISATDEEMLEEISGGTETLLIVEDEELLMMSLQMVLAEKGYNVLSATDGMMALKIYHERKNEIALVLTDLGLPNLTGLDVSKRILQVNPNARIIVATGFLDPEMKEELLKASIENFLFKPYDLKEVLKVVRDVLDEVPSG